MKSLLPAIVVGLIFGAGLALSDMINPARVLAFLDVAGDWDPTLAFVLNRGAPFHVADSSIAANNASARPA